MRTEINEIGEFGLIDRLTANFRPSQPSSILSIGDDAAVLDYGENFLLVSTDMLVEGVHFDLSYVPLVHLGYKAVTSSISDIAAMNGFPRQITIAIGLSNRFSVEAVEEIYKGVRKACESYNIDLIGGDTSSSRSGLILSVTAIGTVPKDMVAYRAGAKENDIVCVSGDLGGAYMGLQILEREKQVYLENKEMQPDLEAYDYVVSRQLRPEARTDIIHDLRERGLVPTSMIDISDGLASEILHLSHASSVGISIFSDNLPIANATLEATAEMNLNPITVALNGGEEYELLMTFKQSDYDKVKKLTELTPIGFVTNGKRNTLTTKGGEQVEIQAQGWVHYS